ncbi:MAG TPA: 3-isopropylmalate dehydratase small subunit [Methylomirabilota bacterium]|nr:3-isopropylmalate dehydratase small subunit [Methylomirabilota bacterium]
MSSRFNGLAHVYGDDIDTDRIIAGKYTKTLNLQDLADHVLEDLDPDFRSKLRKGDVLVAGSNFGCGSSREQAPLALKVAGVSAVVAGYFARIFFRNAINIGLPVLEVPDLVADTGDEIEIDLKAGTVRNVTKGASYQASPMPQVMIDILSRGGLVAYLKEHGTYDASAL